MDRRIYRPADVMGMLGVSRQTLWRMTRDGRLPRPFRLGTRYLAWDRTAIDDWLRSLARETA